MNLSKNKTVPRIPLAGLVAGLLALVLGPVVASAQTAPSGATSGEISPGGERLGSDKNRADLRELSRADRRFFTKAARLGETEVALSRIAERRAIHPRVRDFAGLMIREHTAANSQLADLAAKKGVTIEREDATDKRREETKWNEKSGDDFDEDYLEAMIDAHEDTVDVLENGTESKDPDVAEWARKMLPAVKSHLTQAEQIKKSID